MVNNLLALLPRSIYMGANPISVFKELIMVIVLFVRGMYFSKSTIKVLQQL